MLVKYFEAFVGTHTFEASTTDELVDKIANYYEDFKKIDDVKMHINDGATSFSAATLHAFIVVVFNHMKAIIKEIVNV